MRYRIAVLLIGLALPVAGCTFGAGTRTGSGPAERVRAAAEATLAAGSAGFTMEQVVTSGPEAEQTVASEGEVDFSGHRGRVTVRAPGTGGGEAIEALFDGETIHLRLPDGTSPTPWVRFDLADLRGLPGYESLQDTSSDPSATLGLLAGVVGEVAELGTQDVRGVPGTHYRFTVDLERAVENAPEGVREQLAGQVEALGVAELPIDLWLDAEGRIIRQSFTAELPATAAASADPAGPVVTSGEFRTTIEYFDFGRPVVVVPPPPDQVTDFADILRPAASPPATTTPR